jgi:hypothetical protein
MSRLPATTMGVSPESGARSASSGWSSCGLRISIKAAATTTKPPNAASANMVPRGDPSTAGSEAHSHVRSSA